MDGTATRLVFALRGAPEGADLTLVVRDGARDDVRTLATGPVRGNGDTLLAEADRAKAHH